MAAEQLAFLPERGPYRSLHEHTRRRQAVLRRPDCCLQDLNRLKEDKALLGLAAFLRRRIAYADALKATVAAIARVRAGAYAEVVEITSLFVTEDPEGGKRGQALVAALFDCVYEDVDLRSINNPRPLDVRVLENDRIVLGAEVKQVAVAEDTGLRLAAEARELDCDKAVLVAIAVDQPPLDRDALRQDALEQYGVLLEVAHTVSELFAAVVLFSVASASEIAQRFPELYAARLLEHDVTAFGRERWKSLVEGLA